MPARLKTRFLDASGGLVYHWRAFRYRRHLWRPFLDCVDAWLEAWRPPQDHLVIIGPSAGYTLPRWLAQRFPRITVLEPDPWARWCVRRRLKPKSFVANDLDCFADASGPLALAARFPDAAFLFSNVIGQLLEEAGGSAWRVALLEAMRGRSWASYHDVISTATAPKHHPLRGEPGTASLETTLACYWRGGELILHDHGCFRLGPAPQYAIWSITPKQHHLVEWTCCSVGVGSSRDEANTGIGGRS